MSVLCSAVSVTLPTVGVGTVDGPLASHAGSCDHCRVEIAAYEEMYSTLAMMRESVVSAPSGLQHRVMASLGPVAVPGFEERRDHLVPVAAAAALATAAAGTAVLFRLYRHRAA